MALTSSDRGNAVGGADGGRGKNRVRLGESESEVSVRYPSRGVHYAVEYMRLEFCSEKVLEI